MVKKRKASSGAASIVKQQQDDEGGQTTLIAPSKTTPKLDTSKWPLLLKNYNELHVRTSHYTPIPTGNSPLSRPLKDHLSYGVGTGFCLVAV